MKRTKHLMSIVAFVAAIIVGFMALWIPPAGIIDPSVLWWTAQLLVFTAGILGIDIHFDGLSHRADTKRIEKRSDKMS